MSSRTRGILPAVLLGVALAVPAPAVGAATTCPTAPPAVANGGFEDPVVQPGFPRRVALASFPGWTFTEPQVEVWPPGVSEGSPGGTGPYLAGEGDQFIELNGNRPDGLAQSIATVPGQVLLIEALHRGRTDTNTAAMFLGTAGLPVDRREDMTDSPTDWGRYDWSYLVPPGQAQARLAFVAVTGSGPDGSIGNFLDGVKVAAAGCLTITKQAVDLTRRGRPQTGDVVAFTIRVENVGGHAVRAPVVRDHAPPRTTYVPNSLRIISGPDRGAQTDAAGDDRAQASADGAVRFDVGAGPGDELAPGDAVLVRFRVRLAANAGGHEIVNEAAVGYSLLDLADAVTGVRRSARSDTVVLGPVRPMPGPIPDPTPSAGPPAPGGLPDTGGSPALGGVALLGFASVAGGLWLLGLSSSSGWCAGLGGSRPAGGRRRS